MGGVQGTGRTGFHLKDFASLNQSLMGRRAGCLGTQAMQSQSSVPVVGILGFELRAQALAAFACFGREDQF